MNALRPAARARPPPVSSSSTGTPHDRAAGRAGVSSASTAHDLGCDAVTSHFDAVDGDHRIWTVPNVISMARLLLVPVVLVLILNGYGVLAVVTLAVAGLSDYVDGYIARRFDQMSKLGKLLDPMADRLFIAVTLIGMAARALIPWWLVAAIAARELLVGLTLPVLARRGFPGYPVHLAGKAGTMALMYAFPLLLLAEVDGVVGEVSYVIGWAAVLWGVFLYWCAGALYLHQFRDVLRTGARARPAL
ncbi:CDP-alcohol phosphatidyltransferase family protein [Pseudactinotalea sp. HY158]|nr:CDP-alcohol phosphatidyltransferase family protein [Pseudactinotalea sp. HY158]